MLDLNPFLILKRFILMSETVTTINAKLDALTTQVSSLGDDLTAMAARVAAGDAVRNQAVADLAALKGTIAAGGVTPTDLTAMATKIDAISAALKVDQTAIDGTETAATTTPPVGGGPTGKPVTL